MHVNCLHVPRAQGHIEDIRAKYGDNSNAWRVRVLGEFPTANDVLSKLTPPLCDCADLKAINREASTPALRASR